MFGSWKTKKTIWLKTLGHWEICERIEDGDSGMFASPYRTLNEWIELLPNGKTSHGGEWRKRTGWDK